MFKSECLILIFILVILAILYFNSSTVELFTFKKITINKEENKKLIVDNLQRIIDTIETYKEFDTIVKDLEARINTKLSEKLKKTTTMQGHISKKGLLETEKTKLENENSSYRRDRKKHTDDRVLLRLDVEKLEENIIENKREQDRITKKKEEIKSVTTDDIWLKYLLLKSGSKDTERTEGTEGTERTERTESSNIVEQLLELDKEYESLDTRQLILEKEDKQDQIMELNAKIIELNKNIDENNLELSEIEPQITQLKSKILILEQAIKTLTRQIEELKTEKQDEIIKRTNTFNDLNEQLVSYELEELIEDLDILKKTQRYYEEKLEQFKEQNKIEFGKLKIKEDDYRKHNLIDDLEDDNKQKNMYYKLTNTELSNKLDEICAIDNTQEYCHTRDYSKVCQLDIINNKITDKTNNTNLYNNECLKIRPFINKLPYTITKK
jgi:hypothetical protein